MTKARTPATVEDAVVRVADRIGWDKAAEAVGKDERVIRNWSDPDVDRQPRFEEAVLLDLAYMRAGGGDPPLLGVYQLALKRAAAARSDTADMLAATSVCAKEFGEAIAAAVHASQPGAPESALHVANKEIGDAREALESLQLRMTPPGTVTPIRGSAA